MGVDELKFYKGEKREITATVRSKNSKETVVIASAEFEVKKQFSEEVVQSGVCERNGAEATCCLDLNLPCGNYEVKIKSCVGREVIISKVRVEVES